MMGLVAIWSERAAIAEYDGGLPRGQAEMLATMRIMLDRRVSRHPFSEVLTAMQAAERGNDRPLRALIGG